jgi:PKD repeat protein
MSPRTSFGTGDTSICQGSSATFTDSSYNANSWAWTFSGGTPSTATTQNPTVFYNTPGTYNVTLTCTNLLGNNTVTKSGYIRVAANPVVNLGNDTAICPGATIVLNAGNAGASYLYSNAATTQFTSVTSAGTYNVRVTNTQGCIGRDTIVIAQGTNPVVNLGNDTLLCSGASLTLDAGNTCSSYLYSNAATTQTTTVTAAGSYSVRVTNTSGCIGRDTIVVTTGTSPTVNLGNDTTVCPGATITLNAGNAGSAYLYNNAATTQTIAVTTGGTYSVRVTNAQGCIGRDTIVITQGVNPVVNLGNDTLLCGGAALTLNAGNPGSSYLYSNAATTQTTTISAAGTYTVKVTNAAGCIGRDTILVSTSPNPVVNLGRDTALCPGAGTSITLNAGNPGASYLFSNLATTQTITVTTPGTYSVRVTNGVGCIGRDTIIIALGVNPTSAITASGSLLTAGSAGISYQWYLNGAPIAGATSSSYNATQGGAYTVLVKTSQGCSGTSPEYIYTKLGISSALQNAGYEIYPNPATGVFTIAGTGVRSSFIVLTCYNTTGSLVRLERLEVANGRVVATMNWSSLPAGVYAISIVAGSEMPLRSTLVLR